MKIQSQDRPIINNIINGSLSGGTVFISTLPLDYIKQWKQSGHSLNIIKKNVKKNGIKTVFRGGLIGSTIISPQIALKFGALSFWNTVIPKYDSYTCRKGLIGFLAGFTDGFIFGPFLAIQSYQQTVQNKSIKDSFSTIRKSSLSKYSYPLALRNAFYTMPTVGLLYPVNDYLFGKNIEKSKSRYLVEIFSTAFLLNIPGTLLCSPFDVIRANQIQRLVDKKENSAKLVIKKIWEKNGLRGFYTGYYSLLINFGMRFPLTIMVNEWFGF